MNPDIAAIEAMARRYLDALYAGDAAGLAEVFLPSSSLTQVTEGKVATLTRDAWLERIASRPSSASAGLSRHEHILTIDLVGPTLALVKLKCAAPPRYFTDLLSCLKVDGRWQVAQKVFMTETAS